ncbi:Mom family adenine methylcarbamoylation protein [Streptomyces canus]
MGVLTLGIPTQAAVLTSVFGQLRPYVEALELNRLVLLDEVPANAETWLQARAFRLAAARGVRGVVAHSDPQPRTRLTAHGPETIFPGHYGTIYQAKGMDYLGKTRPRRLTMLPDGSVLHGRAMSKVRNNERGRGGVERRLVALGARPRDEVEPGRTWLEEALQTVGAQCVHHGGHHRYAAYIGPRTGRRLTATSYPYPKADQGGAAV